MRLSIVLVHYHTPQLLSRAHRALAPALRELGGECLVVDNGSDEIGRRVLESLPVRLIEGGGNRGYAAGVNRGVAAARGELLVVMNPDVLVMAGCIERLCSELQGGCDIAGPRFFWDEERRLLIPPAEPRTVGYELLAAAATRSELWARRARRSWRGHAQRYRTARASLPSFDLSGALVALQREAWLSVGPFQEDYRLYFEETDWLARARKQRLVGRYLPEATAVHLFDQSARLESETESWYGASARRFRRRHYGAFAAGLISAVEKPQEKAEPGTAAELPLVPPPGASGLELSPRSLGFPAVFEEIADQRPWQPPPGLAANHAGLQLHARWIDRRDRELGEPRTIEL